LSGFGWAGKSLGRTMTAAKLISIIEAIFFIFFGVSLFVIPAEAGIHLVLWFAEKTWIPAFAGMTQMCL
jgi:hypothetical protein